MENVKTAIEVTQQEFDSRKLSQYGYFLSLFDVVYIILNFAAMGAIVSYVIPTFVTLGGSVYFWQILITILFIQAIRSLIKVLNPLSSYQTIIIRK
jgi:hypothetical protein